MTLSNKLPYYFILSLFVCITSCTEDLPIRNEVVIHDLADPETMNPVNLSDASSAYITNHIFQKLMDADFKNPSEFVPVLAERLPLIEKTKNGKMQLTFQIRKEAIWDNGDPITAKDVEFTVKTIKCPLVNNPNSK